MDLLPIIIVPVYLGIRKVVTQERVLIDQQKSGHIFGSETSLFGKLTYIEFFGGQDTEGLENDVDDVQALFKSTQMIVEKIKKYNLKNKRRSYAVRMSDSKKRRGKNTSNDSPPSNEDGLRIPKLIKIKRKSNAIKLKRLGSNTSDILQSNSNKAGDAIGRSSLGANDFDEDYSSVLNSLKKKRRNF